MSNVTLTQEQVGQLKALCDAHGVKRVSEVSGASESSLIRALAGLAITRGTVSTIALHLMHPTFEDAVAAFEARKAP